MIKFNNLSIINNTDSLDNMIFIINLIKSNQETSVIIKNSQFINNQGRLICLEANYEFILINNITL